ncbi:hypothetical protein T06_6050 [Trichinella sp. T6]|nr:hypothetical protein T06_6050 [Trichinella sp. T6]
MESTSYAIFLCTRHNVAGNFFTNTTSALGNQLKIMSFRYSQGFWWSFSGHRLKIMSFRYSQGFYVQSEWLAVVLLGEDVL